MPIERTEFLGVRFDPRREPEVLDLLSRATSQMPFSYVVTPNVDHVVRLYDSAEAERALKPLYEQADLCLCDSKILHLIARARGVDLPVVPGSELTALMFERVIQLLRTLWHRQEIWTEPGGSLRKSPTAKRSS